MRLKKLNRNQKGLTLIEVLIAIAILGMIAVPFLTALSTSSRALIIADERTTAESLVRTEMEYVKNSTYNSTFSYQDSHYAGYSVNVTAVPIDPDSGAALLSGDKNIQNITVQVYHGAKLVLNTSTYKVDR